MGCVHQVLLFLALVQSALAYLTLESVQAYEHRDDWGLGCSFFAMDIFYRCEVRRESAESASAVPQMLSFRVDCREAQGNFHNLTLFDPKRTCGSLVYKRYANRSSEMEGDPTTPWLRLLHDRTLTIQKGEVFDLECIPLPVKSFAQLKTPWRKSDDFYWWLVLSVAIDGKLGFPSSIFFTRINLLYPQTFLKRELESCVFALKDAYRWSMTLTKSINYTHWVSFSSRALNRPEGIFPKIDLGSSERGDVSTVNKDTLHLTVLEAFGVAHLTKPKPKWLVRVIPDFYGGTRTLNSYSMDFKLEVNEDAFFSGAQNMTVKLWMGRDDIQDEPQPFATLLLPVNKASTSLQSKSWVWFIVFFMLMFLVAAVGYVYRRDLFPWQPGQPAPAGSDPEIEMQGSSIAFSRT